MSAKRGNPQPRRVCQDCSPPRSIATNQWPQHRRLAHDEHPPVCPCHTCGLRRRRDRAPGYAPLPHEYGARTPPMFPQLIVSPAMFNRIAKVMGLCAWGHPHACTSRAVDPDALVRKA